MRTYSERNRLASLCPTLSASEFWGDAALRCDLRSSTDAHSVHLVATHNALLATIVLTRV